MFLTYVVVVVTLVPASFALPPLLTRFKLTGNRDAVREEQIARRYAVQRARERLDQVGDGELGVQGRKRLQAYYDLKSRRVENADEEDGHGFERWYAIHLQLLETERKAVLDLQRTGRVGRAAAERIQRDLDLEATRLSGRGGFLTTSTRGANLVMTWGYTFPSLWGRLAKGEILYDKGVVSFGARGRATRCPVPGRDELVR